MSSKKTKKEVKRARMAASNVHENSRSKRRAVSVKNETRAEQEGKNAVNIIFGVLIALAIAFLLYSVFVM